MKKAILISFLAFAAVFAQQSAVDSGAKQGEKATKGKADKAPAKTQKLTRAQYDQLLANPSQILLIDVRRPDELIANGQFPVYLSIQNSELEKSLAFIPKDRTIITVSNHANRAVAAGDLLDSKGFKVAGAIGSEDYEAEGGTVLKIVAPPPTEGKGKAK
jgi:rhodanese-related sulfurtransferase